MFHAADKVSQHLRVRVRSHEGGRQWATNDRKPSDNSAAVLPLRDRCRGGRRGSRLRRFTDQPVVHVNRWNDDEHECHLRGHADRDHRPYPSRTDMFRSDIRENRGGTPLTLTVKVVNVNSSCAAVVGADVEIWHVDAAGDYPHTDRRRRPRSCAVSRRPTPRER